MAAMMRAGVMGNILRNIANTIVRSFAEHRSGDSDIDVSQDVLSQKRGDIEAKREFFRQAQAKASAGDAESMFFIAMDYGAGGELKTDLAKSAFWMRTAARKWV